MDKKSKIRSKIPPPGLSPAAQKERERFLSSYNTSLRADWESVSLTVMVWGPGISRTTPIAEKRRQIKEALAELGHNPMFSEDINGKDDPLSKELPGVEGFILKETYQAYNAHFVVMLLDTDNLTPGVRTELEICANPHIASKVFILAPAHLKGGFVHTVAIAPIEGGNGAVEWYTDDELVICNVLTKALHRVEQKREIYVRQLRQGGKVVL
jgi:hypothetical protein